MKNESKGKRRRIEKTEKEIQTRDRNKEEATKGYREERRMKKTPKNESKGKRKGINNKAKQLNQR